MMAAVLVAAVALVLVTIIVVMGSSNRKKDRELRSLRGANRAILDTLKKINASVGGVL